MQVWDTDNRLFEAGGKLRVQFETMVTPRALREFDLHTEGGGGQEGGEGGGGGGGGAGGGDGGDGGGEGEGGGLGGSGGGEGTGASHPGHSQVWSETQSGAFGRHCA